MSVEDQNTTQATLSSQPSVKQHQKVEKLALFTSDGTPVADVLADFESRINALENP